MSREVKGEREERRVVRNGVVWRFTKSWHFLDNGERYYYIHAYMGINRLPSRRWAWVTSSDGKTFIQML